MAEVLAHGESPTVAIEATYGWYRAVDALQAGGADVRLVAPAQVAAFDNGSRRVKNDVADCRLLCDLSPRQPAPGGLDHAASQCRDLRELVRYRAKLVGIRTATLEAKCRPCFTKAGLHVNHSHPLTGQQQTGRCLRHRHKAHWQAFPQRVRSPARLHRGTRQGHLDDLDSDLHARLNNDPLPRRAGHPRCRQGAGPRLHR